MSEWGWIAATPQTLPKPNTPVLVFGDDLYRVARYTGDRWQTLPGFFEISPSHWMRLPEPPK